MSEFLYRPDGDFFIPTDLTTGPWDERAQHGGAPSALLTHVIEGVDAPIPMSIARVTFELMRPVPLTPLRVETNIVRPGRKVQLVQASLWSDELEVMRATALRIRHETLAVPPEALPSSTEIPRFLQESLPTPTFPGTPNRPSRGFHTDANEIRFVEGGFHEPGPSAGWIRLRYPVVEGQANSPAMRVAGAADFGNGFSWVLPRGEWLFINPDLTIHFNREASGEWICLRSRTVPGPTGMALAESELYDQDGRVGRSVQSLILEHAG